MGRIMKVLEILFILLFILFMSFRIWNEWKRYKIFKMSYGELSPEQKMTYLLFSPKPKEDCGERNF